MDDTRNREETAADAPSAAANNSPFVSLSQPHLAGGPHFVVREQSSQAPRHVRVK